MKRACSPDLKSSRAPIPSSCSGWPEAWRKPKPSIPKKYTPYETGLASDKVLSTFPSIDTVVDNIKISQGLDNIAKIMDRGTLIRSHRVGDLGFILHSRHQYHWHTGYAPPQSVAAPHMGAVISRTLGPRNPDLPAFIDVGQNIEIGGESDGLKAFHTAGFLGSEHGPFFITDPQRCRIFHAAIGIRRRDALRDTLSAL